jgi:hypothetical protein
VSGDAEICADRAWLMVVQQSVISGSRPSEIVQDQSCLRIAQNLSDDAISLRFSMVLFKGFGTAYGIRLRSGLFSNRSFMTARHFVYWIGFGFAVMADREWCFRRNSIKNRSLSLVNRAHRGSCSSYHELPRFPPDWKLPEWVTAHCAFIFLF